MSTAARRAAPSPISHCEIWRILREHEQACRDWKSLEFAISGAPTEMDVIVADRQGCRIQSIKKVFAAFMTKEKFCPIG